MQKKLYLSDEQKIIAGVSGGLAEYFEVDVTLVRLLWVLGFFAGIGILGYIIFWIVIPKKPNGYENQPYTSIDENDNAKKILGIILIVIGIFVFANAYGFYHISMASLLPIILIGIGILILVKGSK